MDLPTANDEALYIDNLQKSKYNVVRDTDHPDDTKYSIAKVAEIDDDLKSHPELLWHKNGKHQTRRMEAVASLAETGPHKNKHS